MLSEVRGVDHEVTKSPGDEAWLGLLESMRNMCNKPPLSSWNGLARQDIFSVRPKHSKCSKIRTALFREIAGSFQGPDVKLASGL